ncbi:MAG: preprotein translocase subunit YajC [Alphaproteobacteria bacterium]
MIENILIKSANAQEVITSSASKSSMSAGSFVPLILIFVVFYFLIIRPQNKKIKEHQEFVNNLKIGTKIVSNGGLIGVIRDIDKKTNQVEIEIANNVNVKILRNYVSEYNEDKESKGNQENISSKNK